MKISLSDDIILFIKEHNFAIVSTLDLNGIPHTACKGIIEIKQSGEVYLLDLYRSHTHKNIAKNPNISLTAIDEHKFKGYCLKGHVKKLHKASLEPDILKAWEDKMSKRITQRILKNLSGEKGHHSHPESLLPDPKYIIVVQVSEIVDLTPGDIK